MKKVCIVTGTRAEYGLLKPIIEKVHRDTELELQLVVTGMHLSPEFGLTYKEIEKDGFPIADKVEMLLSSDSNVGITKSMAVALMGFADGFERLKPDMVLILGDRYEILMVASAAMIAKIPIAHLHGGELTEGLIDEAIRHSISKMSYLHFTSTDEYRKRVIQLGEQPDRVHCVGALGVENIKNISLMNKEELEKSLGIKLTENTVLLTYHPVTLEGMTAQQQFQNILDVVEAKKELFVVFTKANADTHGRIINQMIDDYVSKHQERSVAFTSLGQLRYLSILQFCNMVIGNSSSGLLEVPSFHIPTINIGERQRGRVCAESVINCDNTVEEIVKAIDKASSEEFRKEVCECKNPYEREGTSAKILEVVKQTLNEGIDIKKKFYDLEDVK